MNVMAIMNAKVGDEFAGPVRRPALERVLAFSGGLWSQPEWPSRNLHTDLDKAREAGLPGIIVSGTQFEGYLIDLLVDLFDEAWFAGGTVETRIPRSLMFGDDVRPKAVLRDIRDEGGGRTFLLDVRCDNQRGEPVLVGTASCRLSGMPA
jgi:hypothetical protein